ncbi:MAG TPA: hypothetical protein VF460_14920 [Burkholderiales bacterium]
MRVVPGLLLLLLACSALAQKDAAEKVQEGNVNNWIEYYKRQRESAATPSVGVAEEKRDERKEKRDERKEKREKGRD